MLSTAVKLAQNMPDALLSLLSKARRCPVPLAKNGKTAAFLVSASDYRKMMALANMTDEEEDRCWAQLIDEMPDEKPISRKASRQLTEDMLNAVVDHKKRARQLTDNMRVVVVHTQHAHQLSAAGSITATATHKKRTRR